MDEIFERLKRKVVFHCISVGPKEGSKDFHVIHTLAEPLDSDSIPAWVPTSLLLIYKQWHGLKLFQPNSHAEEGFKLFNLDEVACELSELHDVFNKNRDSYVKNTDYKDIELWLDGLIPIGEIMSVASLSESRTWATVLDTDVPVLHCRKHKRYMKLWLRQPLKTTKIQLL